MSSTGKVIIGNANFHDVKFEQELVEKKMDSYQEGFHHVDVKYHDQP